MLVRWRREKTLSSLVLKVLKTPTALLLMGWELGSWGNCYTIAEKSSQNVIIMSKK